MPIVKVTAKELGDPEFEVGGYGSIAGVVRNKLITMCAQCSPIYLYLYDKPEDWIIRKTDVLKSIPAMSDYGYRKAVKDFKKEGFWETVQQFNKDGTFAEKLVTFYAFPMKSYEDFMVENTVSVDFIPSGENTGLEGGLESDLGCKSDDDGHRRYEIPSYGNHALREIIPITQDRLLTQNRFNTQSPEGDFSGDDYVNGEKEKPSPPSEDNISKSEFDDDCREILGGLHPRMWHHLARNGFCLKDGTQLRGRDHLREVLRAMS